MSGAGSDFLTAAAWTGRRCVPERRSLVSLQKLLHWSDPGLPWEPEVLGTFTLAAVLVPGADSDLIWVQQ